MEVSFNLMKLKLDMVYQGSAGRVGENSLYGDYSAVSAEGPRPKKAKRTAEKNGQGTPAKKK
jgi:cytolysin (calcineurin-like family phosphatase)